MRRLSMAWFILILVVGGCRPKTPTVPPPVAWEVQATRSARIRPTATPYQQQPAPVNAAVAASTPQAFSASLADDRYQVGTMRQANGRPAALLLRSLASQSLRDLFSNSPLKPILAYYHPNTEDLLRLVIHCNGLSAETLEAEQVILIPLTQTGPTFCPPDPTLAQRYLPLRPQTAPGVQDDERVLVYFTQAGETLSTLARKFEISIEKLRALNNNLDAAPDDLPLEADTVVYLRLPADYRYTPPAVAVPTPAVPRALVFTLVSDAPAVAQPTAAPQVAEARPTPTPEPATPPDTPTPEPTVPATPEPAPAAAVAEAAPEPEVAAQTADVYTTTVVVAAQTQPPVENVEANTPAGEQNSPPVGPVDSALEQHVRFLNGQSFDGRAALTVPLLGEGQPIMLDGDAALKYLSKKNFVLGNAVRGAVRLIWRGNSLELPALGFYDIRDGASLDIGAIQRVTEVAGQNAWVLTQQQFRTAKDKMIQMIMGAYDQLLKDRPNLQFIVLLKEDQDTKGRMIVYIYESKDQQEWATLSGRPLNVDGCPENVQLIMLAATYDLDKQAIEFYQFASEGR